MLTQAPATAQTQYTPTSDQGRDISGGAHRQVIGYLGALLPVVLPVAVWLRPERPDFGWSPDSISAYYWSGAVSLFTGVLAVLSVFLLTYRGYANEHYKYDRAGAIVAGIAAAFVAVFPTTPSLPLQDLHPWWARWIGVTHTVAAVTLFSSFAVFSLWLFRLGPTDDPEKRRRNAVFLLCGIGIVASMAWAGIAGARGRSIFWAESAALWFFALSWLVKGRALRSIATTVQSAKAKLRQAGPAARP